jgi:hypothetical protein
VAEILAPDGIDVRQQTHADRDKERELPESHPQPKRIVR